MRIFSSIKLFRFGLAAFLMVAAVQLHGQESPRFDFVKRGGFRHSQATAATTVIQTEQGFNFRLWLGSNATIGEQAFTDGRPPNNIGCEYPINSQLEHLYGAGLWVGALIDTGQTGHTVRFPAVTTGYDWGAEGPRHEMYGHQTERDTFYHASILDTRAPNRRGIDDDGDGKIDEDELDGYDNDGDWNVLTDDVGADGIPDSFEVGCRGPYDPLKNPDPAFDDYDPSRYDTCHTDPTTGAFIKKNNKNLYTEKNGIADHGEPHVDEDYGAVSESDIYISYKDIFQDPSVPGHVPLGISVLQKSFAWRNFIKEPIIVMEYTIKNVGLRTLDSVYVGYFVDPLVGLFQNPNITNHKYVAYIPNLRTGYANNALDRPSTPIGVTILGTPKPLESLRYTFQWNKFVDNPGTDYEHYQAMSSGLIMPDQPQTDGEDSQFLFAFGSFPSIRPGDSLRVTIALVSGDGVDEGASPLTENAARALALYSNGYRLPAVPPSPPLRITMGSRSVALDWRWRPGDPPYDPMETWDDSDKFVESLPPTDWRRINPPHGHTTGGRIFEGYKLWRSESPEYVTGSFTLLRQYDVVDDLKFGYGSGLQYSYVDSNLNVGRKYWYAVTSFSIPRVTILTIPDPSGGGVRPDTLYAPSIESDISINAKSVQPPFAPANKNGEVRVVPNPYRTDANYTFEEGGWEGYQRDWTENNRLIWFTHLPAHAVIRVFSLAGDVVATIRHDDLVRVASDRPEGQEEWNLLSDSGRAIASGVYIFSVESEFGKQIGKFVIIR